MPPTTDDPSSNEPPTSIDPYKTLSVPTTATSSDIKTAYKRLALRHHPGKLGLVLPDFVPNLALPNSGSPLLTLPNSGSSPTNVGSDKVPPSERPTAHTTFQNLAFAYAVLSDERRRKRYDVTGNTGESLDIEDDSFDWTSFFRAQYSDIVTQTRLDTIKAEYQGSEEEKRDVLETFRQCEGKMDKFYDRMMMSNVLDDDERFRGIIDGAIARKEVEAFEAYVNESKKSKQRRISKALREAKQAERYAKDPKVREKFSGTRTEAGTERGKKKKDKGNGEEGGGSDELASLIQQRSQSRASDFLEKLEMKYANGGKKRSKAKLRGKREEPAEEAFEQTAKRARENRSKCKSDAKAPKKRTVGSEEDEESEHTLASSNEADSDHEDKEDEEDEKEDGEEEERRPKKHKSSTLGSTSASSSHPLPTKPTARHKKRGRKGSKPIRARV